MNSHPSPEHDSNPSESRKHLGTIAIVIAIAAAISVLGYYKWIYQKKIRRISRNTTLVQDGRVLGNAAQQYLLITGQTSVTFGYNPHTGQITGDLTPWLTYIGKGYSIPDTTIESGSTAAFSISFPQAFNGSVVYFSDEGKTFRDPSE